MNNESGINKEELHAFIDGELDPIRAAEFAKRVASDPALAERVAAFRSDKQQLDRIYGSLSDLPVPPEWLQRVRDASVPRRRSFSRVVFSRQGVLAIAASLLLILTVNFWFVYERSIIANEDAVIAEAIAARQDSTRAEQSLAVASVAPEERNQVLTMALSMMLKAPDLTRLDISWRTFASIRVSRVARRSNSRTATHRIAFSRCICAIRRVRRAWIWSSATACGSASGRMMC